MNLIKPRRKGGENEPTHVLPTRSLNKSTSAPSQGASSWISRLGHKIIKSFSAIDSASRDRATQGLRDEERPDSRPLGVQQQDTPAGHEPQVPRLPEHLPADDPKRPAVSWKVLKKYVKGIFKQNEGRQVQDRSSAQPPIPEGSQHLPAQQLPASGAAGVAQRNIREQGPPDPPHQHRPAISPTNMLVKADHLPAGMDREVWCIEDYMYLQKIHSGFASSVYRAVCRRSHAAVALKVYQPDLMHKISQHQLMREARLHARLAHPNIIKLYAAFQQEDGVVLVLELADGGDLLQLLARSGARLSERRAVRLVIAPLLHALYYLHSKAIIHRDIKLENILFHGPDMTLKLADFGLCLNIREERSVTRAGTLDYMAPEVLRCPTKVEPDDNKDRSDLAYNSAVDIWAVGVLAYELLNGVPPFTRQNREDTERLITKASQPPFLVHASDNAKDFIYGCLTKRSQQRPSAWQLLRYSWTRQTLRPASSQRFRTSSSRSQIQDASIATPRPVAARSSSLAARTQLSIEPEIQEEEEEPQDRSSANMVLPNAMPGSSSKPFSSHAPLSSPTAQPERRPLQLAQAPSWSVAARVPARPPNAAPVVDSVAAAARVMMLQLAAAAASSSQSAAGAVPPDPDLSANATGSGSHNQEAAAEGAEGAAAPVDSERSSWMASMKQADSMAAERRSGRKLQHQLALLYESASHRSAESGSGQPRGRALAEQDMSVDSAWRGTSLVRNGDLERAFSDLSRHTTDAGYQSGT